MRQRRFFVRAQPFLQARRHAVFVAAAAATAVLLAGLSSAPLTAALQFRSSQPLPSRPFCASPAAPPPVRLSPFAPTAPPCGGSSDTDCPAAALAAASPSLKEAAVIARAVADATTPVVATPGGLRSSPAAAIASSDDALLSGVRTPRHAGAAAAAAAPAAGAKGRLAFVSVLPTGSSRARGQLQRSRGTVQCSGWSTSCQQQLAEAAAAARISNRHLQEQSWLGRQHQCLAARPARAVEAEKAVVEGDKVNGKSVRAWTVERTLCQALHMALAEEMQRDPAVCIMGEDVGHYGGSYKVTKDLHAVFGNLRVMDTPICENTFTGMAIGAAMNGLRPVVEGMNMGFLLLAFNQISNNAGMVRYTSGGNFNVPVVIRGPGGVGKQLGPEHSQRTEAYLMAVPGLKMVACSTPYNARGLLKSAIREDNPVVFFEHVLTYNLKESIPLLPYTLPLDRAEVAREGSDVTVLAYGKLRYVALDAAKQLDTLGISTEVLDLVSLKPLDMDSICKSVRKTGRCVILDESSKTGGIGGEILSQVMENCADELLRPPVRLATKDIPTPYARELEDATIVTPADVVNAALWMLSSRSQPTIARHVG